MLLETLLAPGSDFPSLVEIRDSKICPTNLEDCFSVSQLIALLQELWLRRGSSAGGSSDLSLLSRPSATNSVLRQQTMGSGGPNAFVSCLPPALNFGVSSMLLKAGPEME